MMSSLATGLIRLLQMLPHNRASDALTFWFLDRVAPGPHRTRGDFWIHFERSGLPATALRKLVICGTYEREYLGFWGKLLRPGDNVIDVGAHEGFVSIFLAQTVRPTGVVIACEPNPENHYYLEKNIALNKLRNIHLLKCALGSSVGEQEFWYNQAEGAWGALIPHAHAAYRKCIAVNVTTLDSVAADAAVRPIRFVKIDTEGSEREVILGGRQLIAEDRPIICFEVNLTLWASCSESVSGLLREIEEAGYGIYQLGRGCLRPFTWFSQRVSNVFGIHRDEVGRLEERGLIAR